MEVSIMGRKMTDYELNEIRRDIYRIRYTRRKIGRRLCTFAGIIGVCAFLYMLGIVGHADFCVETHIKDTWSTFGYITRSIICFAILLGCIKVGDVGIRMKEC